MDKGADSYRRFLAGDDMGLVEIVRDNKDGLMFFINRYIKDLPLAEELTEEAFFRLVTRRPRFHAAASFKTWLYTIGRNLALNETKRRRASAQSFSGDWAQEHADEHLIEQAYLREEQKIQLDRAISRLNTDHATVLHLKYYEEMPNAQIAAVLKRNRRQVENLLYQAKQKLRIELEKEGFVYENLF